VAEPNDQNPYAPPDAKRKPSVASDKIASNNPEDILRHERLTALSKVRHLVDELHAEFLEEDGRSNHVFRTAMGIVAVVFALLVLAYVFS